MKKLMHYLVDGTPKYTLAAAPSIDLIKLEGNVVTGAHNGELSTVIVLANGERVELFNS
jgi:hypothetical protein